MRAGGAEGDPERDGRRTLVNGWEDKYLREGSSVRQFGRPRPLRIRHRSTLFFSLLLKESYLVIDPLLSKSIILSKIAYLCLAVWRYGNANFIFRRHFRSILYFKGGWIFHEL